MGNWVNKQFTVNGMEFDAAIDYNHELHAYSEGDIPEGTIPVELYNCSEYWDICMIYVPTPSDELILKGIEGWIENHQVYPEPYGGYDNDDEPISQDDYIHQEGGYTPKDMCDLISAMMCFADKEWTYDQLNQRMAEMFGYDSDVYRHFDEVYRLAYGETMMDGPYTA